jgi:hypothetical protein
MDIQSLLLQQQSTVRMIEKMKRAGRATQEQLDAAQRRLDDLQNQTTRPARVDQPQAAPALVQVPTGPLIVGDEYASLQADLSKQADQLQRKIADLSNQLHQIPQHVACPHLTQQILDLVAQREAVWDKKYYLERNRRLPIEPVADQPTTDLPELPGDNDAKYELAYQKRRLIDQKSKLNKKLGDPKARPSKIAEWERELAECLLKIQDIEFKLS